MNKRWTDDSARAYIAKVQNGKSPMGLTYCSAVDYLLNHSAPLKVVEKNEETPVKKIKKKNVNKSHR